MLNCKIHGVEKQKFCVNIYTGKVKELCPVCNQERNRKFAINKRIDELKDRIKEYQKRIKEDKLKIKEYKAAKSASN